MRHYIAELIIIVIIIIITIIIIKKSTIRKRQGLTKVRM